MKILRLLPMVLVLGIAAAGGPVHAQDAAANAAAPLTRAQVKMDLAEFQKTHRWDAVGENWVLKAEFEPPAGVKTRAEIKAETTQFLRNNRWDEGTSSWIPLSGHPRELSTLSRAQLRAETKQFIRTHRFDEVTLTWVEIPQPRKK